MLTIHQMMKIMKVSCLPALEKRKKHKAKKNKGGRRSSWSPEEVDDLVDVIVHNAHYQRKLIFINNNSEIYENILKEMKESPVK